MRLRWGFLGCGNLAQALIVGGVKKKFFRAADVFTADSSLTKLRKFSKEYGTRICQSNLELAQKCDIIFLATKPQDITSPLAEIRPHLRENQVVVSLAAGVDTHLLRRYLDGAGTLVRVMGNTPALIQKGFFGIYVFKKSGGKKAQRAREQLLEFFKALGEVALLKSDAQINAVTAASASGVGFVFMFMEQFARWLETRGFAPAEARRLSVETFLGAAELARVQPAVPLAQLRAQVSSKKGTTLAGLQTMAKAGVHAGLKSGLTAAGKRSAQIAKSLLKSSK